MKILSFVEAKIDFPEEDMPEENLKIKQEASETLNEIKKILMIKKLERLKVLKSQLLAQLMLVNQVFYNLSNRGCHSF